MQTETRLRSRWTALLTTTCLSALLLSGCAKYSTEPNSTTTSTTAVQQFLTPWTAGMPDDVLLFGADFDAPQFSLFLDDSDCQATNNPADSARHSGFDRDLGRRGHGFGREDDRGHRGDGDRNGRMSWVDSLQLTSAQKLSVDTAMSMLHACADTVLAAYRTELVPYRTAFAARRTAIRSELDSGLITRDSAHALLDSAVSTYMTETAPIRAQLRTSIQPCLDELDAFVKARLTADQYAIWVHHRGW